MRIDVFPLDKGFETKDVNLNNNVTDFYINIKFEKDGKKYYLVDQSIYLNISDIDLEDEKVFPVEYSRIHFDVRSTDLNDEEITNIIVNFLAHYKLYLCSYQVISRKTSVAYTSPKSESDKFHNLTYTPTYRNHELYIDIEAQLEDGIDYYDFLNIKIKEPIKEITGKEFKELGYKYDDVGVEGFAILDEEQAKEYLKLEND